MNEPLAATLQRALDRWQHFAPAAGANVTVLDGALGAWHGASGVADVDSGEPMAPGARAYVYSITKTFTAAIALRLAERRTLDLDEHSIRHNDPRLQLGGFANLNVDCARGLSPADSTRLVNSLLELATDRMALIEEATASGEGLSQDVLIRMMLGSTDRFEDYRSDWVRLHILAAFGGTARMRQEGMLVRRPPWSD